MNSLAKYVGIAYEYRTYNCWHHVREVRADAGLKTPEFDCVSHDCEYGIFELGRETKAMWQLETPQNYCAVLMLNGKEWHSGVYCDGYVSHCDRNAKQVRLDSLAALTKRCDIVEFWN